jgi:hypothetical protein
MSMKNSSDTLGNRTRDLPDCSAVPQPTALARAPSLITYSRKFLVYRKSLPNVVCALEKSSRRAALMGPYSDKLNFKRHAEESSLYHFTEFFVSSFLRIRSCSVFFRKILHRGIKCDVMFTEYCITNSYYMSQALLHGH